MPRSEALKEAQKRYRAKADKYEKIKLINTKSNKKRYAEDETFRENAKLKQREYYEKRKEAKKNKEQEGKEIEEQENKEEVKEEEKEEEEQDV